MSTVKITVELPAGTHRFLRSLVESGDYASESEAIADALLTLAFEPALEPGEPEFERWIQEEVLPAFDEMTANPGSIYTGEEVLAYLEQERKAHAQDEDRMRKAG